MSTNILRGMVILGVLLLDGLVDPTMVAAQTESAATPGSPEWILGRWQAENGQVWEFEAVNDGREGIITIYEEGQAVDFWGWRYLTPETYHVKRYYDYFESFVLYIRGANEFRMLPMSDVNNGWVLHRLGEQRPEWEEGV